MMLTVLTAGSMWGGDFFRDEEQVIFYNSYGYFDEESAEWLVPMRIYVYEYRSRVLRTMTRFVTRYRDLNEEQAAFFSSRIRDFIVDSESRETVLFEFYGDPQRDVFFLKDENGKVAQTNLNGMAEGEIRLTKDRAAELMEVSNTENGWLKVHSVSQDHTGHGYVRLVPPEGLSVISDVDDTVKITEIPAGSSIMIRNTFFKEYSPAPGMADLYNSLGDDTFFHYVSGSPWQLYRPLSEFLFGEKAGFPKGTFHMKSVTKNFLSRSTWRDLHDLVTNEDVTYDQKISQISQIFEHFPLKEFILIGDSGEADPEVFRKIERMYPGQVREIIIRDVVNAREDNPDRLEGMTIIPAPTIVHGISQFD